MQHRLKKVRTSFFLFFPNLIEFSTLDHVFDPFFFRFRFISILIVETTEKVIGPETTYEEIEFNRKKKWDDEYHCYLRRRRIRRQLAFD